MVSYFLSGCSGYGGQRRSRYRNLLNKTHLITTLRSQVSLVVAEGVRGRGGEQNGVQIACDGFDNA